MKLSNKLILIEFIFILILMGGVALVVNFVALPQVRTIEHTQKLEDVQRVKNTIQSELNRLSILAADWGHWDDTYLYSTAPNTAYETSNLIPETLETAEVDLLIIINQEGQIIWRMGNPDILNVSEFSLTSNSKISSQSDIYSAFEQGDFKGIYTTEIGSLLLASSPILKSDSSGERQGTFFFGKFLTSGFTQSLAKKLEIPFTLTTSVIKDQEPSIVFVDDNTSISTDYIAFTNALTLRQQITIQQTRPFYQQAIKAAQYSVLTVFLVGFVACIATFFLLRNLLISPILYLQDQAEIFRKNNNKHSFKVLNRRDELGALSNSFAAMAKDLSHYLGKLRNERNELEKTSYTDALTGLYNRRYLEDFLNDAENWHFPSTWSFFTLDLDFFKKVNDQYGHDIGDITLQQFAALMTHNFREDDILIRTGGEEFTIICRHAESDTAQKLAERIISETSKFRFGPDHSIAMTCSVGFFSNQIQCASFAKEYWPRMLKISDLALYAAKHSGRNTWIGLECNDCMEDGHYPDQGQEIPQWIANKKFKLVSHLAAVEVHWTKNSLA